MNAETLQKIKNKEFSAAYNYQIKYYEMDFNMALKPSALLNFLQDAATINAEALGFGYSFTYPKNYGWFLIKYRMEFDEYPCDLEALVIKTEARGISKIIANRDFEICTTDGKTLGRVASNWMMIDIENKSILPLAKVLDFLHSMEKRETDLKFEKIKPITKIDYEKTFEIRFDDIDVNQHVNNANYIIWAFEPLPYEFKSTYRIKTLDIVYKKEIAYGNNVISQVEFDKESNTTTHVLKNATSEEELCLLNVAWK